jgi:MFS family permease
MSPATRSAELGQAAVEPVETSAGGLHVLDALQHSEFRLLWFGLVVSNVGAWMQMLALGWLVYSLTSSPFWLGMVGFSRALPVFAFTLWGGVLADRVDRRKVMLAADGSIAACAVAIGIMVASGGANVWLILLMSFLTSSAWAFEVPSRQSLVPELVPRKHMINAIGLQSAAFNGAGVVGPTLAAILIDAIGIAGTFCVNGLLTLAVVAALLKMRPVAPKTTSDGGALSNLVEAFGYVRGAPAIAALFAMLSVVCLIARPFVQLMPAFAVDVLVVGASGLGVLMGLVGAGGLLGAIAVANFGSFPRRGQVVVASGLTFCSMLMAFGLSGWFSLSAALCFLMGFSQNFFLASSNTMIQGNVPGALRGRLMSMYALIMMGFMPLGSMLVGSAGQFFGVAITVAACGLLSLVVVFGLALLVPRVRALE